MKKESTKMKDVVLISKKTTCAPIEIPVREVPSSRMFDIRHYRERKWVLIFMDTETFESFKALCEAKGLDVKKVMYGAIMRTKELLRENGKKNE